MDSKLQIISGRFHGRKLNLPPNARPTQNRARAALFNMLASGIINQNDDLTIWDAFAGSGAFGIECISRYPNAHVIFTDTSPESIKTVRKNLAMIKIGPNATTEQIDATNAINKYGSDADLIFIDPPYDTPEIGAIFVHKLTRTAKNGAILIWEQESINTTPPPNGWEILRDKVYGRAHFLIMRRTIE